MKVNVPGSKILSESFLASIRKVLGGTKDDSVTVQAIYSDHKPLGSFKVDGVDLRRGDGYTFLLAGQNEPKENGVYTVTVTDTGRVNRYAPPTSGPIPAGSKFYAIGRVNWSCRDMYKTATENNWVSKEEYDAFEKWSHDPETMLNLKTIEERVIAWVSGKYA